MPSEYISVFRCGADNLFGILHAPDAGCGIGVVLLVGGPQYRVGSHRMFVTLARHLVDESMAVLRFDYRGMGDSEGAFPGFEHLDDDIRSAVDRIETLGNLEKVVLIGLCDGATAGALYAATDPRVKLLIMINPWVHTRRGEARAYMTAYYPRRLIQRDFWQSLLHGRVRVRASVADLARKILMVARPSRNSRAGTGESGGESYVAKMVGALRAFDGRVLVVLSEHDLTAAEFRELLADGTVNKLQRQLTIAEIADADHTFSRAGHLKNLCTVCSQWIGSGCRPVESQGR